jgi:hypothetical protein
MQVEWYGQSAFRLTAGDTTVAIDPFADMSAMAASRGMQFDYPAIEGLTAELLLVTHEHSDHNGVEVVGGDPTILRSTAGKLESPVGEVTAIASEHDEAAGTERGRTRSSCSSSTACGSPTSATSGRARCGPSRRARSGWWTC